MSRSKYRPRRPRSVPRWFTNFVIVRPERRHDKSVLRQVIRWTRDELEDVPELGKGNKPNADWDWD